MADYIPTNDAGFNIWQGNDITTISTNANIWDIPPVEITTLLTFQSSWVDSFAKASNRLNRTSAAVTEKDDAREVYQKALRKFFSQYIINNTKISNSDRDRLGLNVKSNTRIPTPTPASSPIASVDFSMHMQHKVYFNDENTQISKAKPFGVHGCEIWVKLGGDAPTNASDLRFLGTCTRAPYITNFEGTDIGKTAWYWVRWVNTRGQQGPWSNSVTAIVA